MSTLPPQVPSLRRNQRQVFALLLVLAVLTFNLFYKLNSNRIEDWDEARRGVSAFEMTQHGQYLTPTYLGARDYWSVKPPLGLWIIAASFKIFGPTPWSLRFPSAAAALLCTILVMTFAYRTASFAAAIAAGSILSTWYAFICVHSGRSGEYDAFLALFLTTLACTLKIMRHGKVKFLTIGALLAAITLLKSFAVIFGIVLVLIYYGVERQHRPTRREALLLAAAWVVPVMIWVFARYSIDGGHFFREMFVQDLLQRTTAAVEGHSRAPFFYLERLISKEPAWIGFMVFFGAYLKKKCIQLEGSKVLLLAAWAIFPIALASLMPTKVEWYINSSYPAIALIGGLIASTSFRHNPKLTATFFLLAIIISETLIIYRIHKRDALPDTHLLLREVGTPNARYFASQWTQSETFIAKVERSSQVYNVANFQEFLRVATDDDLFLGRTTELTSHANLDRFRLAILGERGAAVLVRLESPLKSRIP